MYQHYFGLSSSPFSIAPDPSYLFLSDKHREALAHLIYGVSDQGGFVVLTGEVGTGKTTICRCLLQQIPDNSDIAFIINPKQSVNQLLQSMFNDLSLDFEKGATSKELIDQLNHYLLDAHARGRNTILIIDEAQNLSADVLEQLRLLTNLETNEKKLLQLVLLGQPELNDLLAKAELRQLSQRVTARYHLAPLSKAEVTEYIEHRLSIAGCRSEIFPDSTIQQVYKYSCGIPRVINLICDRALLGTYATNSAQVSKQIVRNAVKEIFPIHNSAAFNWKSPWLLVSVVVAIVVLCLVVFQQITATQLLTNDNLPSDNLPMQEKVDSAFEQPDSLLQGVEQKPLKAIDTLLDGGEQ
jgi:general secretion pathway protein A